MKLKPKRQKEFNYSIETPIKWVGGKRRLLPQIANYLPFEPQQVISGYCEPFVGGGAMLLFMLQNFQVEQAIACDINPHLIAMYQAIQSAPLLVSGKLKELCDEYLSRDSEGKKQWFWACRKMFNNIKQDRYGADALDQIIEIGALFIFLNKTCFNGLYRENQSGGFNSPFGTEKTKESEIFCEFDLLRYSKLIKPVDFLVADYTSILPYLPKNTFLYCDPPYRPIKPNSFAEYSASRFNDDSQLNLARLLKECDRRGVKFILSNSDPKNYNPTDNFFDDLYQEFTIKRVSLKSTVNPNLKGDKNVTEIVVFN